MSSHADTIRRFLNDRVMYYSGGGPSQGETYRALDALVAENQQLRDALGFYADPDSYRFNLQPVRPEPVIEDQGLRARAALVGTPNENT
jgi:hypothetical protein